MILALAIAGFFIQDCANGLLRSQEFRGNQVIYSEENFFNSACSEPSVASRSYGEYSLGPLVADSRHIDFIFEKVTLEPKNEAVAAGYRARSLCGIADWSAGSETEITGLSCDFLDNGGNFLVPAAGARRYGIVKEEGDSLFFGRLSPELDGSSPERRPTKLDLRAFHRRPE